MDSDTTAVVLGYIDHKSYAAVCLVCREWRRIAAQIHDRGAKLAPQLIIIDRFNTCVSLHAASESPKVPIWFIVEHPEYSWDFNAVSGRRDLTAEIYLSNPKFNWYIGGVYQNTAIPLSFVLDQPDAWRYSYEISQRRDVTGDIIDKYPTFSWSWTAVGSRCSAKFIMSRPHFNWNWRYVQEKLPVEFIIEHPEFSWNYDSVLHRLI